MKKHSSKQGTLTKLFGKKNTNNNSLYAENPPWILTQGAKKASVDYHDEVLGSFSFLDDSGTATLKARPGPRVRPVLQFSTTNTETQGLAVPTPSVPSGFTDNASIGNEPKLNGNYRMYSSVGDLRLNNYYEEYLDEIPAPPSMPPPPPPTMAPPAPPQESPPSPAISSPASPSPPDFIPPTPNSCTPIAPNFVPPADMSTIPTAGEEHQTNVSKWKSETVLNALSKDQPMSLPNRFSLNPAVFNHSYGQTNFDVEPHSTLPKSFKNPPPAPTRTSSIQLQEHQTISYSKEPPQSPLRSSFNPSFQAKLFSTGQGQKSINDTLNKRKSMLIMEDLQELSQNSDYRDEQTDNLTDSVGSMSSSLKENIDIQHPVELDIEFKNREGSLNGNRVESEYGLSDDQQKQPNKVNKIKSDLASVFSGKNKEAPKHPQSSTEFNKITFQKDGYTPEGFKSSKSAIKVISLKPILGNLSLSSTNVQSKHDSLTRKDMDTLPKELSRMNNEIKLELERNSEDFLKESPPTPPPMATPPPPMMLSPNPPSTPPPPPPVKTTSRAVPNITPPKPSPTMNRVAPPPAPLVASMPAVPQASPLLSPKPKMVPVAPAPPPPAPPPLPSSVSSSCPESQLPLLKALQAKQQTLKQIPKKTIEVRSAQTASISSDNDQKIKVGKIKGELEALFSPKKDDKGGELKHSRPGLEINKKNANGNVPQSRSGEKTLVNSLMLKVPLLPAKFEKDVDADISEWLPKSNKMDIQIPEPDYLPKSPIHQIEKRTYSEAQNEITRPTIETFVPVPASPPKATDTADRLKNAIPTYKPHHERKASAGSWTLESPPLTVSKPDADVSIKLDTVPKLAEIATTSLKPESPISQNESVIKHTVKGEHVEGNSPMALLMAAKKRAEKGNRSVASESGSLANISVTSGLVKSSLSSQYNEGKTFIVVPKKENVGLLEKEVTSFSSNPSNYPDGKSSWRDGELQSPSLSILAFSSQKSNDGKPSMLHVNNTSDLQISMADRNEQYWKPKSPFIDAPNFKISSVPSPIPSSKRDEKIEYGIIPPPAEFMNSPAALGANLSNMQQQERYIYDNSTSLKSDLKPNYEWNNTANQPLASHTTTSISDFSKYTSDNYSTGINRDSHKGSLIKKRLYMPEPESSRNYGKSASSLRSAFPMSYSHMHAQSSSSMVPDPRRSSHASRYLPQGRRLSSENFNRMVPPMVDMKYKSQNSEYSIGKPPNRSQSTNQQGMTFTVRPGSRQPISQTYQGGYL